MTRRIIKSKSGFTLVETVVAVVILGVTLGASILSFSLAMRSVGTARNQQAALHVARFRLETLRTNTFAAAAMNVGTSTFTNSGLVGTSIISNVNSATKNITVNVPYLNRVRGGYSTNTLVTSITTTLHP